MSLWEMCFRAKSFPSWQPGSRGRKDNGFMVQIVSVNPHMLFEFTQKLAVEVGWFPFQPQACLSQSILQGPLSGDEVVAPPSAEVGKRTAK